MKSELTDKQIGDGLRLIRVYSDKKLTEFSKILKISPGYLSEIENGKKHPGHISIFESYAKHLKCKVSDIILFCEQIKETRSNKKRLGMFYIRFIHEPQIIMD